MLDLQHLRAFLAIADAGGVARAANRLHLSQPAVSRQLRGLEAQLGVALFARIGRRLQLTPEGDALLADCRRLVDAAGSLAERARAFRSGDSGALSIGATPPMIESILARFLPAWRRRHPGIDVRIIEDGGASLVSRLERGEVQLAYVPADPSLTGRLLFPVHVIAALPRRHRLAAGKSLEISALDGSTLLALRRGFGSREWFEAAAEIAGLRQRIALDSGSHHVVLELARAGYGIGILPSVARSSHKDIALLPIVHRGRPIGRWTMLAWDRRRYLAPYAAAFLDEISAFATAQHPGRALARSLPPIPRPAGSGGGPRPH